MIFMEIDFISEIINGLNSGTPIMAPDEEHIIMFIKPKYYIRLKDFPKDILEYEKKLQLNFHLVISVINEEKYIEYCRETSDGLLNFLNFFRAKTNSILKSKGYYEIYSPFVLAAYHEIRKHIKENFDPKLIFSSKYNFKNFNELKNYAEDENTLIIPIFPADSYLMNFNK